LTRARAAAGVFLLAVALAAFAGVSTAPAARDDSCTFQGPKWSLAGQDGTTYELDTQGVTCKFATPWALKLSRLPNKKPFYAVAGGPKGWSCNAQAASPKITSGACVKGTKRFGWHAAF